MPHPRAHAPPSVGEASVERAPFAVGADGVPVDVVTLTNARGTEVRFLSYGGVVLSVKVPDRDGTFADVVLGYATLRAYAADDQCLGALVGRYANRIAGGRFTLHGRDYQLARNDGPNHLHGGTRGLHTRHWHVAPLRDGAEDGTVGVVLGYTSPAGEEGYPGTLDVRVTYALTDRDELVVDYDAVTDEPTPVCLTQHTYFNLAGHDAGDVLAHELTIAASQLTPVNAASIPTGALASVQGTPFDFRAPCPIGARIGADDPQLRIGQGYDHNFVLDRAADAEHATLAFAARLRDPASGRTLDVLTSEPGIQVYTGNQLRGPQVGKHGRPYGRHAGVALETQHFPDSPNQPHFPSTILEPGDRYRSRTVYRFGVG